MCNNKKSFILKKKHFLRFITYRVFAIISKLAPAPTGQWGARRSTGGYNTRHDMFAPWAGINEDLFAHALATDHTWYGMDWYWLERH